MPVVEVSAPIKVTEIKKNGSFENYKKTENGNAFVQSKKHTFGEMKRKEDFKKTPSQEFHKSGTGFKSNPKKDEGFVKDSGKLQGSWRNPINQTTEQKKNQKIEDKKAKVTSLKQSANVFDLLGDE